MNKFEWYPTEYGIVGIMPDGEPREFYCEEDYAEAYDEFVEAFDRGLEEWEEYRYA